MSPTLTITSPQVTAHTLPTLSRVAVRAAPVLHDAVPAPAGVQPLQHHRPHRDQGIRHAPVLVHDAQNL